MYLTQSNVIRKLSKEEYAMLREMCQYSNNLYNVALYNIRQCYFQEKKFLNYEENYHVCKENENYKLLQAGLSQQTLKVADRSFKSFFNLIKKAKIGDYRFHDVKMPRYREKCGLFDQCDKHQRWLPDNTNESLLFKASWWQTNQNSFSCKARRQENQGGTHLPYIQRQIL